MPLALNQYELWRDDTVTLCCHIDATVLADWADTSPIPKLRHQLGNQLLELAWVYPLKFGGMLDEILNETWVSHRHDSRAELFGRDHTGFFLR